MDTYRDSWVKLKNEWEIAHKAAREARAACTAAFAAAAAGRSTGPSVAQLDQATTLEARADGLQAQMDQLVQKALGWG